LKEIRLRLHEGEQITATLKVKGEAQVTRVISPAAQVSKC